MGPQGPKTEDQGPWKLGVSQNFFFASIQNSYDLAFIWDPIHQDWTPTGPPRPQKRRPIDKNRMGGLRVAPKTCPL